MHNISPDDIFVKPDPFKSPSPETSDRQSDPAAHAVLSPLLCDDDSLVYLLLQLRDMGYDPNQPIPLSKEQQRLHGPDSYTNLRANET